VNVIRTVQEMQSYAEAARHAHKKIAVVPTMGFLHAGHLSLISLGKQKADVVIVTIFVNPLQFGPGEDYRSYPRDWERDSQLVASAGADCLFAPEAREMYPQGFQTSIRVSELTRNLCGLFRPTHFEGVATVVAKLFTCTKPHVAVFGAKDFQQLVVIRRMVADLNFDIEIVGAPIVREHDGLAMSSRNMYLSPAERTAALSLSRALQAAQRMYATGEKDASRLIAGAQAIIEAAGPAQIDYIKVCDAETLEDIAQISRPAVMAVAAYFGKARLIDNTVLGSLKPEAPAC
jgi:pantoate--beta-alanine ligase